MPLHVQAEGRLKNDFNILVRQIAKREKEEKKELWEKATELSYHLSACTFLLSRQRQKQSSGAMLMVVQAHPGPLNHRLSIWERGSGG